MQTQLSDLLSQARDRLESRLARLAGIAIHLETDADCLGQIDAAMNTAPGIAVLLSYLGSSASKPNLPSPHFLLGIQATVFANPAQFIDGLNGLDTAEDIMRALHHWRPTLAAKAATYIDDQAMEVTLREDGLFVYGLAFNISLSIPLATN